jgi:hypothetical protein
LAIVFPEISCASFFAFRTGKANVQLAIFIRLKVRDRITICAPEIIAADYSIIKTITRNSSE